MKKIIILLFLLLCSKATFPQWTALPGGTSNYLYSVYFPDAQTGYVVGEKGTILQTFTGGTTWSEILSGTTHTLFSVYFTDIKTGYSVGAGGIILKTTH